MTMRIRDHTRQDAVRFHQVEIIELPIILGDNPSVANGPPLTVGWDSLRRSTFTIDFYEAHRPKRRPTRKELLISALGRRQFLLKCGYTTSEIETACMNVQKDKTSRWLSQIERPVVSRSEGMVDDRFSSAATPDSATRKPSLTIPCRSASPSASASRKTMMPKSSPLRRRVSLSKNAPLPCRTTSPPSPFMRKRLPMSPPPSPPIRVGSPSVSPSARGGKHPSPIQGHKPCCGRRQ